MTLCIAAFSRRGNIAITASDTMLSDDWTSAETGGFKFDPIGPEHRWLAMFSGSPSVRHKVIVERLARCLAETGGTDTAASVAAAIERGHAETLRNHIEGEILARFGLDLPTFLERGHRLFGAREFGRLLERVQKIRFETDFLVAGWESSGVFRMFSIGDSGVAEYHDALGFQAIGAGWMQAFGYLCGTYHRDMPVEELLYHVCVAKFRGESAPSVGRATVVWTLGPDGQHHIVNPEYIQELRAIWERDRWMVPADAMTTVQQALHKKHPVMWGDGGGR